MAMHDPATDEFAETPAPPPGVLVADHFVQPGGYHTRRPTGTRDWVIAFTRAGHGRYRIGALQYICRAGDVLILPPGTPHDYATYTGAVAGESAGDGSGGSDPEIAWDFYWAHFWPRAAWLEWLKLEEVLPGLLLQPIAGEALRGRIEQAFVRMLRDNNAGWSASSAPARASLWRKELAENALEEVLLRVAQQRAQAADPQLDARVALVLQHLGEHLRESLSVAQLAQRVGLSPSRLAHLFKQQVGASIIETLLALRLKQAARLLEFSSLSVQQIAGEVGFQSAFYFSRQFKAFYACSPSTYRQRAASDQGEGALGSSLA